MKTYLSGAISSDPNYIEKFKLHETYILEGEVLNPIRFKPFLGLENWTCYMITCIWMLFKADSVSFIPGWEHSKGATIEFIIAKLLRKPCYVSRGGWEYKIEL